MIESRGKAYALGVLEIAAYELEGLPVLDPSKLSTKLRSEIETDFLKLVEAQKLNNAQKEQDARRRLDEAILMSLGLDPADCDDLYEQANELRRIRRERGKKVLVETQEKPRFRQLSKPKHKEDNHPTAVLAKWFPKD